MAVVLICGVDPLAQPGGHPSYVQAHALAAQAAGLEPHVFCIGNRAAIVQTDFGVLHRVATPVRQLLLAPVYHRPVAAAVAEFLARADQRAPHVIHGFGLWAACATSASTRLSKQGIRAVPLASAYTAVAHEWKAVLKGLRIHHDARSALWYAGSYPWVCTVASRLERRGYQRARLVLVNYHAVGQLLRAAHGPGLEIRRLPYAAPAAFRSDRGDGPMAIPDPIRSLGPDDAPLVVSVSRHDPRKGIDVLLRALAALRAAGIGVRACLVGPGRLLGAHRRLAAALGLSGSVAIPGRVADVVPYLRHADVFVLPSLQEGSGSVSLLEALQAGAAVVASACDGIPEDIVDGHNGLLVPPGEEPQLRDALARLLADGQLRSELAARGRQLFAQRFSKEPFVAALAATYAEVASP